MSSVHQPPKNGVKYLKTDKFGYSKEVIKKAEDENTQVSIHAMNLFNELVKMRFESDGSPWDKKFEFWPGRGSNQTEIEIDRVKNLNHTMQLCFELAERFRIGTEIDLWARLDKMQKAIDVLAPSLSAPGANMQKDSTQRSEIPGLHDS